MFGVRPNSDRTTISVVSSMPAGGQVFDQAGERPVELADLLEVEVEVLVVRVVVGVRDLDEADALVEQPAGEQAVPAEVVPAVAVEVPFRLLGHVEDLPPFHQLQRLVVAVGEGVGLGGPAAAGEPLVGPVPEGVAVGQDGGVGVGRAAGILRRLAVAEDDAGVLRAEVGGVVAPAAAAAGGDDDVAGQRARRPGPATWP